ncbi:Mif2/CENP-C like-domain-containing protein [Hypoxylon rubiginosum]|uniref:Mif2/CENP-C like-domain-containing protein n=1 Tax=Hypoxylon rubiginosum TaxID=110542 RepID=A0ACC0D8B9_9PEZI|nr:Mif2/CENP-C like-domain-containing protein [Hypoxylon rubiginosum]
MPPKSQSQRRVTQSQTESVYELGVQGRKTGLTLAERPRDENGMEAFDDLFSSPEKDVTEARVNGANRRNDAESDEEQEMEIDEESQMGPATIMKQRQNRPSLPRARSPIKTHLQSPARQNPHLGLPSSPSRGSYIPAPERDTPKSVNRRLDFSKSAENRMRPPVNGQPKVNGVKGQSGKLTNGRARTSDPRDEEPIVRKKQNQRRKEPEPEPEPEEEEEEEEPEESMQILDAGDDEVDNVDEEEKDERDETPPEPEPEVDDEEEPVEESPPIPQPKAAKRRGRKPKSPVAPVEEEEPSELEPASAQPERVEAEDEPEPVKKRRGRPARSSQSKDEIEPTKKSPKRGRPKRGSGGSVEEESQEQEDNGEERETKRQRTEPSKEARATSSKATSATTKEKGKPGRRRKSSGVGVEEPVVQRGPPLPKSRGLVINRSEEETNNMHTTRSGRLSFKPIEFWRGEHPVFDDGNKRVFEDKGGRQFVMPTIKGILRTVEPAVAPPKRRRGRPSANKDGPRQSVWARRRARGSDAIIEEEEVIERDDWEFEPGRIAGDCLNWRPEYEGVAVDEEDLEVAEEELAISEAAIQLKDIKDATFRFAKTLTMPFFGSGVVDMPPGSEKRTKNSRKMQMVFFVHQGSVEVTVANTEFRIGKGGMWFVPRGNHYSIANNTERSARIFFAQGCEMVAQEAEE